MWVLCVCFFNSKVFVFLVLPITKGLHYSIKIGVEDYSKHLKVVEKEWMLQSDLDPNLCLLLPLFYEAFGII